MRWKFSALVALCALISISGEASARNKSRGNCYRTYNYGCQQTYGQAFYSVPAQTPGQGYTAPAQTPCSNGTCPVPSKTTEVKPTTASSAEWLTGHETIQKLLTLTNQERARQGKPPVELDPDMCMAAQRHATYMSTYRVMQHSGYPGLEIIHGPVPHPENAVQGWINSPTHHSYMLSGTKVGFGYDNVNGHPSWVGVFR